MRLHVVKGGVIGSSRPRRLDPMTPVRTAAERNVYTAPVTQPGGPKRRETWEAVSLDGLWYYERVDDDGTPWVVTYQPTGQTRSGYGSLLDCRRATYGDQLRHELRADALRAAYSPDLTDIDRRDAQRWLAIYLVEAALEGQPVTPAAVCRCGGQLTSINYRGENLFAHLDACSRCWQTRAGRPLPFRTGRCAHRFCDDPAPRITPPPAVF